MVMPSSTAARARPAAFLGNAGVGRDLFYYKESPKIANRITENCKSGESGFFELSFLFI